MIKLASLAAIAALATVSLADIGSPVPPAGGQAPCHTAPPGSSNLCLNLYEIACGRYQKNYDRCATEPNPAQCRQFARNSYFAQLAATGCEPEMVALVFEPVLSEGSLSLVLAWGT
jgi:hypothetical protein